jgi:hypothetical protein
MGLETKDISISKQSLQSGRIKMQGKYRLNVQNVEVKMSNASGHLPPSSDGLGNYSESRQSRFMRKDVRTVVMSFRYFGNEVNR